MKDFFELLRRVFASKPVKRKPMPRKVTMPPQDSPIKVEVTVKKKDRIQQLEDEVKELREQGERQTELLVRLTQQLSALERDIAKANILPEK